MKAGKQRHEGGRATQKVAAADLRHHPLMEALQQRGAAATGPMVVMSRRRKRWQGAHGRQHEGFLVWVAGRCRLHWRAWRVSGMGPRQGGATGLEQHQGLPPASLDLFKLVRNPGRRHGRPFLRRPRPFTLRVRRLKRAFSSSTRKKSTTPKARMPPHSIAPRGAVPNRHCSGGIKGKRALADTPSCRKTRPSRMLPLQSTSPGDPPCPTPRSASSASA